MRLLLVLLVALVASACERPLMVYNGCNGSWVRVHDGRGNLLVEKLVYGQERELDVRGYAGGNIELLAVGFDLNNNRPLGSATTSRYIPNRSGSYGPTQMHPWEITSLYTSDPNGGCQRR